MRLIDADRLIEQGYEIIVDGLQYGTCNKSIDINDIPTAFDVDKIVRRFEEHARKERELELNSNEISENYHIGKARGFVEAIKILKESGKNERI